MAENQLNKSSKQYIEHKKAELFGDRIAEAKFLVKDVALQCKQEGTKRLKIYVTLA